MAVLVASTVSLFVSKSTAVTAIDPVGPMEIIPGVRFGCEGLEACVLGFGCCVLCVVCCVLYAV